MPKARDQTSSLNVVYCLCFNKSKNNRKVTPKLRKTNPKIFYY